MKVFSCSLLIGALCIAGCASVRQDREVAAGNAGSDDASMRLEEAPVDLDSRTPSGLTLLHRAVDDGNPERTKRLLEDGIQVDVRSVYGWTALHMASEKGLTEIMTRLLDAGASVDARTNSGETAFHLATAAGQSEAAELLVSRGASTAPARFPEMRGEYFGQPTPGPRAEPFAIRILATRHDHYNRAITFSADGREAYWPVIDMRDDFRRWIASSRIEKGVWTSPRVAGFSRKAFHDDVPSLAPGGNRLLFLSRRPLFDGDATHKENIWFVTRVGETWSEPAPLPGAVNSFGTLHQQICLDRSGKLYFGSEASEGYGSLDIYFSTDANGEYQQPVNLGPAVNGPGAEYGPSISPDGDYLIFTRNVDDGWSLFISFDTGEGNWSPPADLRDSIEGVEEPNFGGSFITHDGRFLIFFGEREETVVPYWTATTFIESLRAEALGARGYRAHRYPLPTTPLSDRRCVDAATSVKGARRGPAYRLDAAAFPSVGADGRRFPELPGERTQATDEQSRLRIADRRPVAP